jgi:hypothetical protein
MSAARTTKRETPERPMPGPASLEPWFALAAGCWIALTLAKFGNPVIFGNRISAPANLEEFLLTPWPIGWGYVLAFGVLVFAVKFARPEAFQRQHWPIGAMIFWLVWQLFSHTQSVDQRLSTATLVHFAACGVSFLIGWLALGHLRSLNWFWALVLLGFSYVLISGFDQHHGGLEATRRAIYEQPNWQLYPKEYLLRLQSNRIFSTLVYPNAFAGVILLLLPISLWQFWEISTRWHRLARAVGFGLLTYLAVACLYWTGSKGGWLIALAMGLVLILHLSIPPKMKLAIMTACAVLGLVFFFVRYSGYFQKGATSVSARFIYWQAAIETVKSKPIFGTGPGTFSIAFAKIKPPEAEMAKLTHNDFLEQASDSGILGGLSFSAFVFGSMYLLYRQRPPGKWDYLLLWTGLLGWTMQSFIEFGLYIPAISWPAFLFLGFLWSQRQNR